MSKDFNYSIEYYDQLEDYWTNVSFPVISLLIEDLLSSEKRIERTLDLGCGNGIYFSILKKYSDSIVGIDISPEAINRCLGKYAYSDLKCTNAYSIPYHSESFDLVFSTEVIEHIENPQKTFKEVYRILKPGGIFIFTTTLYYPSIWTYLGLSVIKKHSNIRRCKEIVNYILGYFNEKYQEEFVLKWCFETLGGHYHGFHIRQLKALINRTNLEIKQAQMFYAVNPIPNIFYDFNDKIFFSRLHKTIFITAFSLATQMANGILKPLKLCANNIFVVANK